MAGFTTPGAGGASQVSVDAIQADVGDASSGALGSLYAILGNWAANLVAAIGYEGAAALANKLTAARAALLDRLSIITAGGAGELTAARAAALQRLIDDLTAARAGYLDNLAAAVSVVGSPYSQPNDLLENDAIVVAAATQLVDIELDMNTLAQANTVREYVQVDGANYRQVSAKVFPTDFDTGTKAVILSYPQKGQLYKITMQSSVLEGGAKNVPFRIMTRDLV